MSAKSESDTRAAKSESDTRAAKSESDTRAAKSDNICQSSILTFTVTSKVVERHALLTSAAQHKTYPFLTLDQPFQIMPTRFHPPNYLKYPQASHQTHILVHAGYDVKPFTSNLFLKTSYIAAVLLPSYMTLCRRIGADMLLIHGPESYDEYKHLKACLMLLKDVYVDDVKMCVEMPAFAKSLLESYEFTRNPQQFIKSYLHTIVDAGFEICVDTAHMFANGMSTDDVIDVLNEFREHYSYIHLNGNSKPSYSKDKHTTLTPHPDYAPNLIPDVDKLLGHIAGLGVICVSEQKCNDLRYFETLAKTYGFTLANIPVELII